MFIETVKPRKLKSLESLGEPIGDVQPLQQLFAECVLRDRDVIGRTIDYVDPIELQCIGWNAHKFADFQTTNNANIIDNMFDAMHHIDDSVDIDTITWELV